MSFLTNKIFILRKPPKLISKVDEHEGLCWVTWVNRSGMDHRLSGGVTGFFKLMKNKFGILYQYGEEFHGIIRGNEVHTTKGMTGL